MWLITIYYTVYGDHSWHINEYVHILYSIINGIISSKFKFVGIFYSNISPFIFSANNENIIRKLWWRESDSEAAIRGKSVVTVLHALSQPLPSFCLSLYLSFTSCLFFLLNYYYKIPWIIFKKHNDFAGARKILYQI